MVVPAVVFPQPSSTCTGYLAHPFKKDRCGLPDRYFPWNRDQLRDKGNVFFSLDNERRTPSSKQNRRLLAICAPGSEMDAG
jgi:hypothetical protein